MCKTPAPGPFLYKLKIWENRIWIEQGRDTDFNITWNVEFIEFLQKTSNFEIKFSQKISLGLFEISIIWAWIYSHVFDSTLVFTTSLVLKNHVIKPSTTAR